jgi:holo-[acyl-carrier protein] synthase
MILGIGLDVVNVERLLRWRSVPGIFDRFFHRDELADAKKKGNMELLSLAARWAAKEAFGKALGTGLKGFSMKEVSILNDRYGKPHLRLYGKAKQALLSFGGERILVTLTHEKNQALAVVIIEGE